MRPPCLVALAAAVSLLPAGACRTVAPEPEPAAGNGPSAQRGEEAPRSVLRWRTASEIANFGFDVYRSRSPDGPFRRITELPIAGAGNADTPRSYSYADLDVEACEVYFYYVESISMEGEREPFTPVVRARPQGAEGCPPLPAGGEGEEG